MVIVKLITNYLPTAQDKQLLLADGLIGGMKENQYFADGEILTAPVVAARTALEEHIEQYPNPDESQTAARNVLRLDMLKKIGSVSITANQRFTGNAAALLSTTLKLQAARTPLLPPAQIATFTLADGERSGYIRISAEKDRSEDLLLFRFTTDATLEPKNFECCLTGDTFVEVLVNEGEKLRAMVAAGNKATRPENIIFTAVKTRIGQ